MTDDKIAALEWLRDMATKEHRKWWLKNTACAILAHIAALEAECDRRCADLSEVEEDRGRWRQRAEVAEAREAELRAVLKGVDDDVRHHLRSDRVDHAVLRKHVVQMVRQALAAAPAPESRERELDKRRLDGLRELCGYVEDGSETSVNISQDDATHDWIIRAGKRWWHGESLREAIDAALQPTSKGDE